MTDVATLVDRLELLEAGQPLPGDDAPAQGLGTRGRVQETTAACRVMNVAITARPDHVPARIACELFDNLGSILPALRYWRDMHMAGAVQQIAENANCSRTSTARPSETGWRIAQRVEQLVMISFEDQMPVRDPERREQTILTYSAAAVFDISFYESSDQDSFERRDFGAATHWIDITGMWPGVTAQVTEWMCETWPCGGDDAQLIEALREERDEGYGHKALIDRTISRLEASVAPSKDREAVARLVDPDAWSGRDQRNHAYAEGDDFRRGVSLRRADAILALVGSADRG